MINKLLDEMTELKNLINGVKDGSVQPTELQTWLATHSNWEINSDQEKWLDDLIANQRTEEARQWEEQMASNDLLRAGSQLEQLGLSSSGVLQTGGSSVNSVAAADTVKTNMAQQRLDRQNAIARSLISMASAMAHAGITGGSIGLVRSVASRAASATAHSAEFISREEARQAFIKAGLEEHYNRYYGR